MKDLSDAEKEIIGCYGDIVRPHPDGEPWTKCCGTKESHECMCFTRKPLLDESRCVKVLNGDFGEFAKNQTLRVKEEGGRFFCLHRMDGEYHRECAGWARMMGYGKNTGSDT